jgi:hypothetical protein
MIGLRWALPVLVILSAGCAATGPGEVETVRVRHVVLLKLADAADAESLLRDCDATLSALPGVLGYWSGTPLDTERDLVDGDYDVGLYMGFASEADYDAYIDHRDHEALVERWRPRLQWIRIHDLDAP